jgi:hypothetical protein
MIVQCIVESFKFAFRCDVCNDACCVKACVRLRALSCTIGPPLWSSGQCSWLQIRKFQVRFPGTTRKKVVGLERGSLSLVSTTEELLGSNSSGSGLESREYGRRDSSR